MAGSDFEDFFPHDRCVSALAELSDWTSVQDVLAACRILEDRIDAGDDPAPFLVMPIHNTPQCRAIMMQALRWLMEGYRVPSAKIDLARSVDGSIAAETVEALVSLRFEPTIRSTPANTLPQSPSQMGAYLAEDQTAVIELVQAPLRCLGSILQAMYGTASACHDLRVKAHAATGGAPAMHHRPYADSRLYAVLEALCFYAFSLGVGLECGSPGDASLDMAYRSVNLRSAPPLDGRMLDEARAAMGQMLDGLR